MQKKHRFHGRHFAAVGGGQAVENFDWLLYGLLAAYFSPHFFPSDSVITSTLSALAVFGVAFVARPLGAIIFGPFADRIGRRPMMLISVTAIAICSLGMGLMPTSEVIGWWAPILLVTLRILQGMSIGIEQPLLSSYGLEMAPQGREAWYAGVLQAFSQAGLLLASMAAFFTSLILGADEMSNWGWRVPFIIGGLIGFVVLWMRRNLPETLDSSAEKKDERKAKDVLSGVAKNPLAVWAIIFIVGGTQVINYGWTSGIPSSAAAVFGENPTLIFGLTSLMTFVVLVMNPIVGRIADRYGMGRTFVWGRLLSIPFTFLTLAYIWPSAGSLIIVMAAGAVILPLALSFFNAIIGSLVPRHTRVTGVGIGYSIGVAVFGGTASYVFVWLTSVELTWLFPVYVSVILAAGAGLFIAAYKRTGLHDAVYSTSPSKSGTDTDSAVLTGESA